MNTSTKSLQLLSLLIADFCNKIDTERTHRGDRAHVRFEGGSGLGLSDGVRTAYDPRPLPALFELLPVPIPQQTLYARNDSTWRASFSSVW